MKVLSIAAIVLIPCLILAASLEEADLIWEARHEASEGPVASAETIEKAISLYSTLQSESPENLEVRWKLMRARYFLGRYTGQGLELQKQTFQAMINDGELAFRMIEKEFHIKADDKPEKIAPVLESEKDALNVFFYQSVAWGQWALAYGKLKAVKKGAAKRILKYATVCYLADPGLEQGGAQRVLGRLHHQTPRVPFLTGWASNKKSLVFLREAVKLSPENRLSQLFLGELLLDEKGQDEAKEIFASLASSEPRESYMVEDTDAMEAAKQHLSALGVE